jgi:hypothetical protein
VTFSTLNNVGEPLISADTRPEVIPTDTLFLAHTISPQSIPYLGCEAAPYAAQAKTPEQIPIVHYLNELLPLNKPYIPTE